MRNCYAISIPTLRASSTASRSLFAVALFVTVASTGILQAADWPTWRGPNFNSISNETGLVDEWDPRGGEGSNLVWKNEKIGGRSTPVVVKGKLYTLLRDQPNTELEGEKVVCADAATGEILWEHRFNVYLSDVPDSRVGWSSVAGDPETGRVYAQGVCGYFCCLEGDSGKVVWERSLHEELGLLSTYGGRTNFPIVYGDTVIASAIVIGWGDSPKWSLLAKPAHRFMGFDKATGELRWLSGTRLIPYDTTYSTPTLTRIDDQDLLVFGSGDGAVWGMQPGTGKTVWNYPFSRRGLNVSPVVDDKGRVFSGHSEENLDGYAMGAAVAIDGKMSGDLSGKQLWNGYQVMAGKSSPLAFDDKVYITTDSAKMLVFDANNGRQLERKALGRSMRGSPLYADGKIYVCTVGGRWWVLQPQEDGKLKTIDKLVLRGTEVNASPIVADGRIYLTTADATYCIGKKEGASDADAPGFEPALTAAEGAAPTQLQLSPWDSLLAPGDSQQFTPRFYTADGKRIKGLTAEGVEFSVDGPGSIDSQGRYQSPKDSGHEVALITAQRGDLSGQARLRIVPPLPWKFDFEEREDVPLTWVGGRIRYNLRDEAGNKFIAKPIELPTKPGAPTTKLGTRSRMWMGPPTLENYTVQADVQLKYSLGTGATTLPSAGLINSGYTFALFGPNNEARLYSWCTHDHRTQAAAPMNFEAGVWYTMKIRVHPEPDEGHAHVHAKVWPRANPEPKEWMLEFEDEAPNYQGSPGLFGDSKEAEFYVDNLMVEPN